MKSRKNASTPHAAPLESLESRRMFSASLYGSTLYVDGTAGSDTIQVSVSYGPFFNLVNVYENGVNTAFPSYLVSRVNVYGYGGNDTIGVGAGIGATYLSGGDGDDRIYGGNANDTIVAGNGNDTVFAGNGNDYVYGGFGDDEIHGGGNNDALYGDAGSDWLLGDSGADSMYGGDNNDYFTAADGENDYVSGGAGWDTASVDKKEWWEFWATADSVASDVEHSFEP
jgi:Ca2+-binding RTX toxin-like protein